MLQNDSEMKVWVLNLYRLRAGSFLQSVGEAAQRADIENYALMRPLLLALKFKYPDRRDQKERMKVYLGDFAYAEMGEMGRIVLTAENGITATDTIVLEPETYKALQEFAKRFPEMQ